MAEKQPLLSIIVTHYKEPWDMVKNFFTMLDIQRDIDFSDLEVLLVHDGHGYAFSDDAFVERPYYVQQLEIDHAGVSAARNAGTRAARGKWVLFCDCDDMFAHPFALMDAMDVLNTDRADIIWGEFCVEDKKLSEKPVYYLKKDQNYTFIHAKFFRRAFLLEKNIAFDPELSFGEDTLFVTTAFLLSDDSRRGKIVSKLPLYVWCDTDGSVTNTDSTKDIAPRCTFTRNRKVCDLYKDHQAYYEYCCMVARTVTDAYYYLNRVDMTDDLKQVRNDFYVWFKGHEAEWKAVSYEDLKQIKECSRKSAFIGKGYLMEDITVTQWLKKLDEERSFAE